MNHSIRAIGVILAVLLSAGWATPQPAIAPLASLEGHTDIVEVLAIARDGKTLASAGKDKVIRVWDLPARKQKLTLVGKDPEATMSTLAFSPDGKALASGGVVGGVTVWDLATRKPRFVFPTDPYLTDLAFTPDGKILYGADADTRKNMTVGQIKVWDVTKTGIKLRAIIRGRAEDRRAHVTAYSLDFKKAAGGDPKGEIAIYDLVGRKEVGSLKGHTAAVTGLAFSSDGNTLASSSNDGTARLWDLKTSQSRLTLGREDDTMYRIAFSPDDKLVAAAMRTLDLQELIKLWDAQTGKERATLKGHANQVSTLLFTPDGKALVSASYDKTIRLWAVPRSDDKPKP